MSPSNPARGAGDPRRLLTAFLPFFLLLAAASPVAAQSSGELARIQAQLDRGDAAGALSELKGLMKKGKPSGEAYLLRSTAHAMAGDPGKAAEDLKQAVKVDPTLRQAWLNLAGLEIVSGRYETAYEALVEARKLDPTSSDNDLNLGAVLVLQGRIEEAEKHFDAYLAQNRESAEAAFLVASNYALTGYESQAVEALRAAVRLDERMRLKARSDERFLGLESNAYRELLATDLHTPPADHRSAAAAFERPYSRQDPELVYAVLDALKHHGYYYDPAVETTESWALIWGEMRIKIFTQPNGTGVVSLSASPGRFAASEWDQLTRELFKTLYEKLAAKER